MDEVVYAYWLRGSTALLGEVVQRYLGASLWHWVGDAARLQLGEGAPAEWRERGAVFNERGELRWWRRGEEYEALLLAERPASDLEALEGHWRARSETFVLQPLDDRRVSPSFGVFPTGKARGRLVARICYRDGVPVAVSPRAFRREGGER